MREKHGVKVWDGASGGMFCIARVESDLTYDYRVTPITNWISADIEDPEVVLRAVARKQPEATFTIIRTGEYGRTALDYRETVNR